MGVPPPPGSVQSVFPSQSPNKKRAGVWDKKGWSKMHAPHPQEPNTFQPYCLSTFVWAEVAEVTSENMLTAKWSNGSIAKVLYLFTAIKAASLVSDMRSAPTNPGVSRANKAKLKSSSSLNFWLRTLRILKKELKQIIYLLFPMVVQDWVTPLISASLVTKHELFRPWGQLNCGSMFVS